MSDHVMAFPGGRYHIDEAENARLCAAVGAEPDKQGRAHPMFYYVAGQCGMGISVADLCAAFDFDVDDGPMMIGSSVAFARDLLVGGGYRVEGGVTSIVRKASRTFGAMDQLTFELLLSDSDGAHVAKTTNVWVLPRPQAC